METRIRPEQAERDIACERAISAVRAFADLLHQSGDEMAAQSVYEIGIELNKLRRPEIAERIDAERLVLARRR